MSLIDDHIQRKENEKLQEIHEQMNEAKIINTTSVPRSNKVAQARTLNRSLHFIIARGNLNRFREFEEQSGMTANKIKIRQCKNVLKKHGIHFLHCTQQIINLANMWYQCKVSYIRANNSYYSRALDSLVSLKIIAKQLLILHRRRYFKKLQYLLHNLELT